ncbi:MAG: hypothetical protein Q8L26_03115 [Candidatus Omnitrophota bacterium]|nr:hypothetical protein [Candidatus Omnitrophota bacterium]
MKKNENRRKRRIFANQLHKEVLLLVFLAAIIPVIIVSLCLYYLIFNITASEIGIPEFIAYNIIPAAQKVTLILLVSAPTIIFLILIFAYKVSHKIVGPFDRIIRELDEIIEGKKKNHIALRKSDKFCPLVEKINKLLDKAKT